MMDAEKEVHIQWEYSGKPDALVGTGATLTEQALTWIGGGVAALVYVYFIAERAFNWSWWQYLIAFALAFDVGGGIVANGLNSCKRYYHAPIQPEERGINALVKNHMVFTLLHVYPIIIGLVFGPMDWTYSLLWYGFLVVSAWMVLRLPLYLHRPTSMLVILFAIIMNYYFITPVPGFEWFIPALFIKIIYGHIVREEPYRPA